MMAYFRLSLRPQNEVRTAECVKIEVKIGILVNFWVEKVLGITSHHLMLFTRGRRDSNSRRLCLVDF